MTLHISTDIPCAEASTMTTTIAAGTLRDIESRPISASTTRCDEATGTIGSLVFVPGADDNEQLAIRVVSAMKGRSPETCNDADMSGCIVARRVLRYVSGESLALPVVMRDACSGVVCPFPATCSDGRCTDSSTLEAVAEPVSSPPAEEEIAPPSPAPTPAPAPSPSPAPKDEEKDGKHKPKK